MYQPNLPTAPPPPQPPKKKIKIRVTLGFPEKSPFVSSMFEELFVPMVGFMGQANTSVCRAAFCNYVHYATQSQQSALHYAL